MHYVIQVLDWLEPLTFALGACVSFWAFRRCRKRGYLVVALYFCLAVFSVLAMPRINAELRARRTPAPSEETERKINAAINEAVERVMGEEGAAPGVATRKITFPLEVVLVLGVWLLARREPRVGKSDVVSENPTHEPTTA